MHATLVTIHSCSSAHPQSCGLRRRWRGACWAVFTAAFLSGCHAPLPRDSGRWNEKYAYVQVVQPIVFHYDHGVLAGSYPDGVETVAIGFEDVCAQLGHVCLCGAGGFRIAGKVVDALRQEGGPLERGEFILISGRDHTVSDVIAFVLGCERREDFDRNQYFIDGSITAPQREYHYCVAYRPARAAVHVVYRKHLLVGDEEMNRLWQIECAFERDPATVSSSDMERYRRAMVKMVSDVLFDRVEGLITVQPLPYEAFQQRLDALPRRTGTAATRFHSPVLNEGRKLGWKENALRGG